MSFSSIDSSLSPAIEMRRHTVAQPWTYALLDAYQHRVAGDVRLGRPGKLLLSEVSPVITLGRRPCQEDVLISSHILQQQGVDIYATDRGGRATYHGPGQWILFAVESLMVLTGDPRGVRKAVEALLTLAWIVAREYDPSAEIRSGTETGVWVGRGSTRAKVSSVGVQIEKGVLLHGVAINGFRTPHSFSGIRPCGLDLPVAFLLEGVEKTDLDREFCRLGERILENAVSGFPEFGSAARPEFGLL